MRIYEKICDGICEIFYKMKKSEIKSNGRSRKDSSKLDAKSIPERGLLYVYPRMGRSWTLKDLDAYCKHPKIREGVKDLSDIILTSK